MRLSRKRISRGLLRLWIVASLGWVACIGLIFRPTLPLIAWPWSGPPVYHAGNGKDYPVAWGAERVRAAIKQDVVRAERQRGASLSPERMAACEGILKALKAAESSPTNVPHDCDPMAPTVEEFRADAFPDAEFREAAEPTPIWDLAAFGATMAFGPPLVVLVVGAALLWAIRGFHQRGPHSD
jgi:hypothetical protein